MKRSLCASAVLGLSALALLGGCRTDGDDVVAGERDRSPSIDIAPGQEHVLVGDTTTFIVKSRNTVGYDAEVQWTSTGGEIQSEQNGSIARARFDQPGVYTITSTLLIDGREVDRDAVNITVRPLR